MWTQNNKGQHPAPVAMPASTSRKPLPSAAKAAIGRVLAGARVKMWSALAALCLALISTLAIPSLALSQTTASLVSLLPQFLVVDYTLVTKAVVAGTPANNPKYDYTYRVSVRNGGAAVSSLAGHVISKRASVLVTDADVSFGSVGASKTQASSDTFAVRADRFFDRRLDTKKTVSGHLVFDPLGDDLEDRSIPVLGVPSADWTKSVIDVWYLLKLSFVFDWKIQSSADTTSPTVTNTSPQGNITTTQPTISASYSDSSGVVAARVVLKLDGVVVTSSSTVSATGISYRPAAALGQGVHTVALSVPDTASNTANVTWAFTVDSLAPTITAQAPLNIVNAAPNSAISAQFSDLGTGMDLTKVQLLVDAKDVSALVTKTASGMSYQPATSLATGTHTVSLKVSDLAGNTTAANWSFGVDASAPAVTNLSPASASVLAADALPTISAGFSDAGAGVDTTRIKLFVDAVDVTAQAQILATGISYRPSTPLSEGLHNIKLSVADRNGNSAGTLWSFTTTTPPEITAVAPKDVLLGGTAALVISAQYRDIGAGIDTTKVKLLLDGVDVSASALIGTTGLSLTPAAALSQGLHQVQLSVTDKAGNSTATSWSFTLDNALPLISNEQPKGILVSTATPLISANFQDAGAAASASGINPSSIQLWLNNTNVTGQSLVNTTSAPGLISYTPTAALAGGTQTVKLVLADKAGNQVQSLWTFNVDGQGPVLAISNPTAGALFPADALPTLSANFSDTDSGIDATSLVVLLDTQNISALVTSSASGFSYTPAQVLAEGSHTLSVTVKDKAGNASNQSVGFKTATPPVISAASPKDVFLPAGVPAVIAASYSDIGSGVDTSKVKLSLDGVDISAQALVSTTGIRYSAAQVLTDGVHQVALSVSDKAGNASAMSWSFSVDTALPVISNEQPKNALVNTAIPSITANFQDGGTVALASGIDASKTVLLVNGVDVTAQAQIATATTPGQISFTPAVALAQGTQTVQLRVADKAGNVVQSNWSFTVDSQGPALTITSPTADQVLPADALPQIAASFGDSGSGVDTNALQVLLDGQNITALVSANATGLSYTPAQALAEGSHTLSIRIKDKAGNASDQSVNFKTATPPVISGLSPVNGSVFPTGSGISVGANLSDIGSGIDLASIRLTVDGANVTGSATVNIGTVTYNAAAAYGVGQHNVELVVADKAGNATTSRWAFELDQPAATAFTDLTPRNAVLPSGARPVISANFIDASGIAPASVRLVVDEIDVTAQANPTATGVSYLPAGSLAIGRHVVYLKVTNTQGRVASTLWSFEVDASVLYSLNFTEPSAAKAITQAEIAVKLSAASDRYDVTSVQVNGQVLSRASGTARDGIYTGKVTVAQGDSTLNAVATYADGQTKQASISVNYSVPPTIRITAPVDKTTLGPVNPNSPLNLTGNVDRPVTIIGTLSKPVTSVTINQQQAVLNGLEFRFENFFLHEGNNFITAVATDAQGRVGNASIIVSVDQTAPLLGVESPLANSVTSGNTIDVRGTVNDAVAGYYGATNPTVTISSSKGAVIAKVDDKQFLAANVPLEVGENLLTVTATDQVGNARSTQFKVIRTAAGSDRLTVYSGHLQSATVTLALPQPLVAAAIGADGKPMAGVPVVFEVLRGTGYLSTSQAGAGSASASQQPVRRQTVSTDANGLAQAWHTLGKQSGPGSDAVKASATNVAEEAVFIASAAKAPPQFIRADLGVNQFVATSSQPLEPLTAVVIDAFENRIPNAVVTFKVAIGSATFDNGLDTITATTDNQGLAAVRPTAGADAGQILVYATVAGAPPEAIEAAFTLQALKATDGPTLFSGLLQNDKGEALPGARMSIGRTALTATTDANGQFSFADVPTGKVDLFVDGRTINVPGQVNVQYPSLHFEAIAVKGAANRLTHPIYLPPLLMSEAKIVGGNEDVILKMPGIDGYEMRIFANSVSFPDGSKVGPLVVSPIAQDKLPMAPPGGYSGFMAPAATLQPAGTRFDPPAQLRLPNTAGFAPGEKRPMFQWDHDLGTFVQMGQATVTDDGLYLVTDAGTGISKAGWHPIPNPPPPEECPKGGGVPDCKECADLTNPDAKCPKLYCKPRSGGDCDDGKFCTRKDTCVAGACIGTPIKDEDGTPESVETNLAVLNTAYKVLQIIGISSRPLNGGASGDFLKFTYQRKSTTKCCEADKNFVTGHTRDISGKAGFSVGPDLFFNPIPGLPSSVAKYMPVQVGLFFGGELGATVGFQRKNSPCSDDKDCWQGAGNSYIEATISGGVIVKNGPITLFRATIDGKTGFSSGLQASCDTGQVLGAYWSGLKVQGVFEVYDGFVHFDKEILSMEGQAIPGASFTMPN
jgi:Bacterial Ig-like domain/Glucodextranase, domain B